MSDDEAFLSRWSRRKLAARLAQPDIGDHEAAPPVEAAEPIIDPPVLPAIEDIVADTDIRDFLKPGVPFDLARSALRRAWSADVAIRDFVGPADYAWDFNTPGAMAGFGPLAMSDALRDQLVETLLRPLTPAQGVPAEVVAAPEADLVACPVIPEPPRRIEPAAEDPLPGVLDDEQAPGVATDGPAARRRHGGAMPA
jgi:hypothetical protein